MPPGHGREKRRGMRLSGCRLSRHAATRRSSPNSRIVSSIVKRGTSATLHASGPDSDRPSGQAGHVFPPRRIAARCRGRHCPATGKYRQAPQEPLVRVEERIAPGDGVRAASVAAPGDRAGRHVTGATDHSSAPEGLRRQDLDPAAASSIASGRPSRRRQTAATARGVPRIETKPGRTARARSTKRRTASFAQTPPARTRRAGKGKGSTGNSCSPRRCREARLVASTCSAGQPDRSAATRSRRRAAGAHSCRAGAASGGRRTADEHLGDPAVGATSERGDDRRGNERGIRQRRQITQTMPSAKCSAISWAIASVRRVLPTPPGPVNVRRGPPPQVTGHGQ